MIDCANTHIPEICNNAVVSSVGLGFWHLYSVAKVFYSVWSFQNLRLDYVLHDPLVHGYRSSS